MTFQYRDSYGYGTAVLLALVGWFVDVLAVRVTLAVIAVTLFAWPTMHRRFSMTPAITLMVVCAAGFIVGAIWQLFQWGNNFSGNPAQDNVSIVSGSQEAIIKSSNPGTASIKGRYYSREDKERVSELLYNLLELLDKKTNKLMLLSLSVVNELEFDGPIDLVSGEKLAII